MVVLSRAPAPKPRRQAKKPQAAQATRGCSSLQLPQTVLQRCSLSIVRAQRCQPETLLDRLQNRKRIVLRVIHKMALGKRSNDDSWNTCAITPDAVAVR